jgi:methylenetetrahydrofolate--tRNA-(uracil-5-)-methyltransferase
MHRNSYLDAPRVIEPTLALKSAPRVLIAGQLTGLEGYVSAIASGLWAGMNASRLAAGLEPQTAPEGSCLGAMLAYMSNPAHKDYAPTAFSFGMLTWLPEHMRKQKRDELTQRRAREVWPVMRALAGLVPDAGSAVLE